MANENEYTMIKWWRNNREKDVVSGNFNIDLYEKIKEVKNGKV
jgi:hypothetical protein